MIIALAAVPAQMHKVGTEENWSVTCAALVDFYWSGQGGGTEGKGFRVEVALLVTFSLEDTKVY